MALDWLNQLANGDRSDQTAPDTTDFSLAPTTPVKSNLMGNILQGVPGMSGYSPMQQNIPAPLALPSDQPTPAKEEEETPKEKAEVKKVEKSLPKKATAKADEEDEDEDEEETPAKPQAPVNPEDYGTPAAETAQTSAQAPTQTPAKKDALSDLIDNLKAAQQRQQDMQHTAMVLEGAQQIGAGLARQAPEKDYMKSLLEASKTPVQNVIQQADIQKAIIGEQRANAELALKQAAEAREGKKSEVQVQMLSEQLKDEQSMQDPNSQASQAIRDTMAQRLQDLSKATGGKLQFDTSKLAGLSGKQVETLYGKMNPETVADTFVKTQANKEATQARLQMMQAKQDEINLQRQVVNQRLQNAAEQKKEDKNNKEFTDAGKEMDAYRQKAGALGGVAKRKLAADYVNGLITQFPDYNIPANQTHELSAAVGNLVGSGSNTSQKQIDAMVPSSMRGNLEKIASWVTNEPTGLQQQKFMRLMHETAIREGQIANNQMKSISLPKAQSYDYLRTRDPQRFDREILGRAELTPDEYDAFQAGKKIEVVPGQAAMLAKTGHAGAQAPSDQDKAAIDWAKKNSSDPRAAQILKLNGM